MATHHIMHGLDLEHASDKVVVARSTWQAFSVFFW